MQSHGGPQLVAELPQRFKKKQATSRRLGQCGTIVQRANLLTTLLGVIEAQLKSKRETATHQPTFRRRTGT